jgi:hypothetical protein
VEQVKPAARVFHNLISARELAEGKWPGSLVAEAREHFEKEHFLVIKNFFDSFLIQHINQLIEKTEPEIFHEADEGPQHSKGHIFKKSKELQQFPNMILNNKNVLKFFREITGMEHLKFIGCYPYRSQEEDRHAMRWHQDMIENKIFVISINLSPKPYKQGEFAFRFVGHEEELLRISNTDPGSLIIARIRSDLEHCTTKVTGNNPRITLAGWGFTEG